MPKQPKEPTINSATKRQAAKKVAAPKPAAKKTAATQPAVKKPAAKKAAKKSSAPAQFTALLVDAAPAITSPAAGPVTANTALTVTMTTNRNDLPYEITLLDTTGAPPSVVYTAVVPAPGVSPFTHTIPAANLTPGRTLKIRVKVDPAAGSTPPNGTDEVIVNTLNSSSASRAAQ
ncbi:hypothetical protein GobsT_48330 [Gemmata obscuriglobus]|uniref:hypothetical protein n=1 Tax=Gemmata obscuriglobus TaxID=114 RepID=UPI00016C3566|nr:hypothetical protein [Gemmata obscuriglobus]QEG30033.1 hypothetical protein GobsT_48330 [Gemmata obscuriglobus]VTS09354.1 unnamed protein product [Gemmata obscuriglobus UQM 2246]